MELSSPCAIERYGPLACLGISAGGAEQEEQQRRDHADGGAGTGNQGQGTADQHVTEDEEGGELLTPTRRKQTNRLTLAEAPIRAS